MNAVFKFVIIAIISILVFASKLFSQVSLLTEQNVKPALYGEVFYPGNDENYPAIIILHGSIGLSSNYQEYQKYASQFVEKGYVVLLIDLYAETGSAKAGSKKRFELWKTWQKILKNGVKYLKALPNVNKNQIGIIGFSRGAWITLTTISSISDVKVVIDYYGVGKQALDNITNIPPTLMLYGEKDYYADSSFVFTTYNMLKEKNKDVELIRYPNADHGFNFYRNKKDNEIATIDAYKKTLLFLGKHIKEKNKDK